MLKVFGGLIAMANDTVSRQGLHAETNPLLGKHVHGSVTPDTYACDRTR